MAGPGGRDTYGPHPRCCTPGGLTPAATLSTAKHLESLDARMPGHRESADRNYKSSLPKGTRPDAVG